LDKLKGAQCDVLKTLIVHNSEMTVHQLRAGQANNLRSGVSAEQAPADYRE
jgi:hypothetical protein